MGGRLGGRRGHSAAIAFVGGVALSSHGFAFQKAATVLCPVEETDDRGRKTRTTEARDKRCGIPQGLPISPLLANLYMRRFVLGWKMLGLERSLGTRIVTYADDLVILCRKGK